MLGHALGLLTVEEAKSLGLEERVDLRTSYTGEDLLGQGTQLVKNKDENCLLAYLKTAEVSGGVYWKKRERCLLQGAASRTAWQPRSHQHR